MKKQFKNTFATGIDGPVKTLLNIFFTASSIGSGVCLGYIAAGFVYPSATFETHTTLFVVAMIIGLITASLVDFLMIKRLGRFAFAELLAWCSSGFVFSTQRKLNTIIFLSIAIFGIGLSFVTSYDGASIAAGMAPKLAASATTVDVVKSERAALASALSPYRKAVKSVKSEIKTAIDAKTSAALKQLINEGNQWAKGEKAAIKSKVERKYYSKLAAAQQALQDAEAREQSRTDKAIASASTSENEVKQANKERQTIVSKLLVAIGVLPLIFGVLLLVAEGNNLVTQQMPEKQKQKPTGSNAGARTGETSIQNLYANP